MKRLRKLRVRLVLWTVMIEAVLLLIFSGVFIFVLRNEQNSQIEETLHLSAVVDLHGSQYVVAPDETSYLRTRGVLARILSPTGELGGSVGGATQANLPGKLPATDRLANSHLPNGEPVRLFVTKLHEGDRVLGTLVLAAPLRDSQTFIRQILLHCQRGRDRPGCRRRGLAVAWATAACGRADDQRGARRLRDHQHQPQIDHRTPSPRSVSTVEVEHSYSFPGGHTSTAIAFYGLITVLLWREHHRGWARLSGGWVLAVAFSRVYLGVHYLSDVLGSLTLGVVWLFAVLLVYDRYHHETAQMSS